MKKEHELVSLASEKYKEERSVEEIKILLSKYNVEPKKTEKDPNLKDDKDHRFTETNFNDITFNKRNFFSSNDIKLL